MSYVSHFLSLPFYQQIPAAALIVLIAVCLLRLVRRPGLFRGSNWKPVVCICSNGRGQIGVVLQRDKRKASKSHWKEMRKYIKEDKKKGKIYSPRVWRPVIEYGSKFDRDMVFVFDHDNNGLKQLLDLCLVEEDNFFVYFEPVPDGNKTFKDAYRHFFGREYQLPWPENDDACWWLGKA